MKKFLFVLPAILLIVAGCSSANISQQTNQKTPTIPQTQNPVVPTPAIKATDSSATDVANPTPATVNGFKVYSNKEVGVTFQYPETWPEPVFIKGNFDSYGGAYPDNAKSQWIIYLGNKSQDTCEGETCYLTEINGYFNRSLTLVSLDLNNKKDLRFAFSVVKESTINNNQAITYDEVGISENKSAFVFNGNKSIRFSTHDSSDSFATFDKILGTISL